jgi:hypothetical protein
VISEKIQMGGLMKKIAMLVAVAGLMMPTLAMAKGNHPMAGCGLGYLLLSHDDNSRGMQILGATTNETGTQTFGITSETSGCTEDGAVKLAKSAEVYAEVNLDSLRREMAQGQGEFVATFASLLGARGENVDALVKIFQTNYTMLYSSSDTSATELLSSLQNVLNSHKDLLS